MVVQYDCKFQVTDEREPYFLLISKISEQEFPMLRIENKLSKTLGTSGEDLKLHSERVEKMLKYTRNECIFSHVEFQHFPSIIVEQIEKTGKPDYAPGLGKLMS